MLIVTRDHWNVKYTKTYNLTETITVPNFLVRIIRNLPNQPIDCIKLIRHIDGNEINLLTAKVIVDCIQDRFTQDRYRRYPVESTVDYEFLDNGDFQLKRSLYNLTETCEEPTHV
jgi:hypothetical protein